MKTSTNVALALVPFLSASLAAYAQTERPTVERHDPVHHHHHDAASGSSAAKKGKGKKTTDPNEASNLIAAKISQLELDAAGEQEQEAEIGWFRPF